MATEEDLRACFAVLERRVVEHAGTADTSPRAAHRQRVRRRQLLMAAGVAVAVAAVAVTGSIVARYADDRGTPTPGSSVPTLGARIADAAGTPAIPRLCVQATGPASLRSTVRLSPGSSIDPAGELACASDQEFGLRGTSGGGYVVVFAPGAFDPALMTSRRYVMVDRHPGYFGEVIPLILLSRRPPPKASVLRAEKRTTLAWRYGDDRWAVVQGPRADSPLASLWAIASTLDPDSAHPQRALLPFRVTYLPPGTHVSGADVVLSAGGDAAADTPGFSLQRRSGNGFVGMSVGVRPEGCVASTQQFLRTARGRYDEFDVDRYHVIYQYSGELYACAAKGTVDIMFDPADPVASRRNLTAVLTHLQLAPDLRDVATWFDAKQSAG